MRAWNSIELATRAFDLTKGLSLRANRQSPCAAILFKYGQWDSTNNCCQSVGVVGQQV